ncbi:MAG: PDZ domain-containing protein [Clostridia bacterium]|nr:PDZ domain-containing protein [Clostridia bacterium]
MKKNVKNKILKILMFILPLAFAAAVPLAAAYSTDSGIFNAYLNLINERSTIAVDTVGLDRNLIDGALGGTDRYSYFQETEAYESQVDEYQDANFVGIGVTMVEDLKGAYVTAVFVDSPASRAGIRAGDIIVSVDGHSIEGKSLQEIAARIKGPVDTRVSIGILVNGSGPEKIISITRANISVKTVAYTMYGDSAYIRITGFTDKTGDEFREVLDKVGKTGSDSLIIDLRNNGGGTVRGCIFTAMELLSDEKIVKLEFRYGGYLDLTYMAPENDREYRIAVLVNENTASAAEILSAAIQENERGILVGETTYGKSLVQSSYRILTQKAYEKYSAQTGETDMYVIIRTLAFKGIEPAEEEWLGAIKLTIGEYLTPLGKSINNSGIKPDISIEYDGPIAFDETTGREIWIYEKYDVGMASEQIKKAKYILGELGYYNGDITGYYDEATFDAVMRFQADEGLYPYGVLDFTTQGALNNRQRLFDIGRDPQFMMAYGQLERNGD